MILNDYINFNNSNNCNNYNNCTNCNMEDFILYIEGCLNEIQEIKDIKKGYTIEFYVDGIAFNEIKIENREEIISQCLSFYRNSFCEILCKSNHSLKYNNLKENLKTQVFNNPSGILHISSMFNTSFKQNCIDIHIYDKEKNKNDLLEYIKNNSLNEVQKEHIINSFEQNDAYNNSLAAILDDIKKEILDAIDKPSLQNLINDMNYTIFDLINEDISEVIIGLIDKSNETYSIYRNLISVVKVEQGYLIMFCKDVIYEIRYNLGLYIV